MRNFFFGNRSDKKLAENHKKIAELVLNIRTSMPIIIRQANLSTQSAKDCVNATESIHIGLKGLNSTPQLTERAFCLTADKYFSFWEQTPSRISRESKFLELARDQAFNILNKNVNLIKELSGNIETLCRLFSTNNSYESSNNTIFDGIGKLEDFLDKLLVTTNESLDGIGTAYSKTIKSNKIFIQDTKQSEYTSKTDHIIEL